MRTVIISFCFLFFLVGCGKKATVSSYSNVNVPIKNLEYVHLNIEGSSLFQQRLHERIPIVFLGKEILVDDPSSPNILHIIENKLQHVTHVKDSEEIKKVKYIRPIYNSTLKRYENKTIYIDRRYYTRCWIDRFELSSSVTTRYKRDTLISNIEKEVCRTQRYNIFYKPNSDFDENAIYNQLVTKLRDKIINYLVPYRVYYNIDLEDELDIEVSKADEESFENLIDQIDNGFTIPAMIDSLEVLNDKYPNSYTIHFTIAVLYEIYGEYDKALVNYQKALKIKPSKKLLKRIEKVIENQKNLEKIKG